VLSVYTNQGYHLAIQKVTAAVIEKDGKILIAKRKRGDSQAGKWEFPGGKLEPGETPESCLKRELREELGIETEVGAFFCSSRFVYPHMAVELLVYRTSYVSGEITLHAHDRAEWIAPETLSGFDFSEADKPVVRKLKQEAP
jgi:8-oxo-dGTP diphosphatase